MSRCWIDDCSSFPFLYLLPLLHFPTHTQSPILVRLWRLVYSHLFYPSFIFLVYLLYCFLVCFSWTCWNPPDHDDLVHRSAWRVYSTECASVDSRQYGWGGRYRQVVRGWNSISSSNNTYTWIAFNNFLYSFALFLWLLVVFFLIWSFVYTCSLCISYIPVLCLFFLIDKSCIVASIQKYYHLHLIPAQNERRIRYIWRWYIWSWYSGTLLKVQMIYNILSID